MHRRKQGPIGFAKDETKQLPEVVPAITFAFLSVSLTDAKGTNFMAQLATAARCMYEQHELWKNAEQFFQTEMSRMGCLIKVHGDLPPAASYLILAPRVKLLPEVLLAAKDFMTECASFKSLQLQLQLGRSAVVDQTGVSLLASSPFFNAQWRQHCNGSECVQLFTELAPKAAAVHAIISKADLSAEAKKLSLQYGSDLKQVLAQVPSDPDADEKLPLGQCTAGCTMTVPADGMVFMIILIVPAGDKILYNLVT